MSTTRKVIRGDSDSFQITFLAKNSKGKTTPINICGWDIRFTVRKDIPSTSTTTDTKANGALIFKTADILDAANGIAYFTITSSDTEIDPGEYWYDIQYIKPADTQGEVKIKSLPRGKYIVLADVTRNERGY